MSGPGRAGVTVTAGVGAGFGFVDERGRVVGFLALPIGPRAYAGPSCYRRLMQPIIAESAPHRARFFWVIAGLAAATTAFLAARPLVVVVTEQPGILYIGNCRE